LFTINEKAEYRQHFQNDTLPMIPRLSSLRDFVSARQASAMSLATAGKQIQTRMIGTSFDTEQSQHAVEDVIEAVGYVPMGINHVSQTKSP
jgi:hypothetical protein